MSEETSGESSEGETAEGEHAESSESEGSKGKKKESLESKVRKARVLAFDLDNTLVDFNKANDAAIDEVMAEYGITDYVIGEDRDDPVEVFKAAGLKGSELTFAEKRYISAYVNNIEHLEMEEGALELLHQGYKKGYMLAVVSNNYEEIVRASADQITKLYNKKYGKEHSGRSLLNHVQWGVVGQLKPSPIPMYGVANALDVSIESVVMAGDSTSDARSIEKAGGTSVTLGGNYSGEYYIQSVKWMIPLVKNSSFRRVA